MSLTAEDRAKSELKGAVRLHREGGPPRRTLREELRLEGTGIHSGAECSVRLFPRETGGIAFRHAGRDAEVPARLESARADLSERRTVIESVAGGRFEQVEHLLAALAAAGVSDLLVEQEGPEVPFLGGGAREFLEGIRDAGTADLEETLPVLEVVRPLTLSEGHALIAAMPHKGLRLSAFVEFPGTVVGSAGYSADLEDENVFFEEISKARTFAAAADIEKLRAAGLIRGGNLENAVVFDRERYHNESLHYPDEVVRHKIIDLLGDLSLLGTALRGHFWAWRGGHRSHVLFARRLQEESGTAS